MFFTMIKGAFFRQKGKMAMIAFTTALGVSLACAMLNVMLDAGDKVNRELKTYGANINVLPKGASLLNDLYAASEGAGVSDVYLSESELGKIKTIFWAFNIVDFTPYLETKAVLNEAADIKIVGTWFNKKLELPTGETLITGMTAMKKWWDIDNVSGGGVSGDTVFGKGWISDTDENLAMAGINAAQKHSVYAGDKILLEARGKRYEFTIKSVFNSASEEDDYIYVTLSAAQKIAGRQGLVSRVEVSALTTPDNELAVRAAQNPKSLSIKEWETWYCTAYVSAIFYQITEVITDSVAKHVRRVAQSEGAILEKTELLMLLITILSLLGASLGISNLIKASVMERSSEIGLLKALGAADSQILALVLAEILITGMIGGIIGYFSGIGLAQIIGHSVFGSYVDAKPVVAAVTAVMTAAVIAAGSIPAMLFLSSLRPVEVLHGRGH
jgi:putative ABC transport system permease protein